MKVLGSLFVVHRHRHEDGTAWRRWLHSDERVKAILQRIGAPGAEALVIFPSPRCWYWQAPNGELLRWNPPPRARDFQGLSPVNALHALKAGDAVTSLCAENGKGGIRVLDFLKLDGSDFVQVAARIKTGQGTLPGVPFDFVRA